MIRASPLLGLTNERTQGAPFLNASSSKWVYKAFTAFTKSLLSLHTGLVVVNSIIDRLRFQL